MSQHPADLERAADELMVDLAEVDEDDEVRPELIREHALEHLRASPPDAVFGGMSRDDAIYVIERVRDLGGLRTAGALRDGIRRVKGKLASGDAP